jgi:hypothetical protein
MENIKINGCSAHLKIETRKYFRFDMALKVTNEISCGAAKNHFLQNFEKYFTIIISTINLVGFLFFAVIPLPN